jgi:hypothetical protein
VRLFVKLVKQDILYLKEQNQDNVYHANLHVQHVKMQLLLVLPALKVIQREHGNAKKIILFNLS